METNSCFRTIFELSSVKKFLSYDSCILSNGSCFAALIGDQLRSLGFSSLTNPFGTLYHPKAIKLLIEYANHDRQFDEALITEQGDIFYSWHHHSDLSTTDRSKIVNLINDVIIKLHATFVQSNVFFFTLGTAWYYKLKSNDQFVVNCHKHPSSKFTKHLSSVEDIQSNLQDIVNTIQNVNEESTIVFTVSPVRHLKDGFIENQLSKAALLVAVNSIVSANEKVLYFPAYEIMMDDLRDYRFYADDMLHPNSVAQEYIWKRFQDWSMDADTKRIVQAVDRIKKAALHRPFNPESAAHQKFLQVQINLIDELESKHKGINLSQYKSIFSESLI